jgi:predicted metalloprotease with PDZ domain
MVVYSVSLLSISQQTLRVSVSIPALAEKINVKLPAWIPGSYMIRDFAKHLGEFKAVDASGKPLLWNKVDKQRWQIHTHNQACVISYTIVANDYSVRGAFINDEYVFFNGTSAFIDIDEATHLCRQVQINTKSAPSSWHPYTAMEQGESPETFISQTYEELIDNPFFWGTATVQEFNVSGITFRFLLSGKPPIDTQRITQDLIPICQHHLDLFDAPYPIDAYLFITLLADTGYGGLEHRKSTVLMYPRFDLPLIGESNNDKTPPSDTYIDYLSLCSHEFFHTWHVKRLRPKALLKPNLSSEVYTEQLWIYEGITSFYDDVALARTHKMSAEHYLKVLGKNITRLLHTPGKEKQSVAESSFDAWTRFYKQDANSNNHIVSYYTKGGIIALGLDLLLRQETQHKVTLDHVMDYLWQHFGKHETGTTDEVISETCRALGVNVDDYLERVVYGTEDPALEELLPLMGVSLHFRAREQSSDKGGTNSTANLSRDVGATWSQTPKGLNITQIQAHSAAENSGLMIGDTIIAANDWLVTEPLLLRLIESASTENPICLAVARQGRLLSLPFCVQAAQKKVAYLTIEDKAAYHRWLYG